MAWDSHLKSCPAKPMKEVRGQEKVDGKMEVKPVRNMGKSGERIIWQDVGEL